MGPMSGEEFYSQCFWTVMVSSGLGRGLRPESLAISDGGTVCGGTDVKIPKGWEHWELICVGREMSFLAVGSLG